MSKVIAIGNYSEADLAKLKETFDPVFLAETTEIGSLDEATRAGITAAGFKGHKPFGAEAMDLLPNLGVIANFGVGYDSINVAAASERDIRVTNTPDVLNDDVADLAVAMLLMCGREMEHASQWARSGSWAEKGEYRLNRKVSGGRAGILGLGRIGREIAERLVPFKMDLHYWSRSEKETPGWTYHDSPEALAAAVDYLIVATVGGKATENIVSKEVLEALGPRGILVNISRGSTVDEEALIAALKSGGIYGAGLDVFVNEPKIDARFYEFDNVVIQPHQGSGTVETRAAMAKLQRDNISAFLAGNDLLTPVN
ncbi:2-hydroxyacid dehydrogenase [Vannielia litorea]|uniref:2-hydroxyacid dehydrogenase n=1 Tax=Vannielia TaxID=2813041 RepID=UPI001C94A9F4|nr:2-hydroxyacid dehydrogenase [Vannielia litorea]MBY6048900.1 2-hydroxyacid dehydrogenase [Vannielia litorea]MBY6076314.1 2-hydroxyacid dehydrogenase [Vannielia litorea]